MHMAGREELEERMWGTSLARSADLKQRARQEIDWLEEQGAVDISFQIFAVRLAQHA